MGSTELRSGAGFDEARERCLTLAVVERREGRRRARNMARSPQRNGFSAHGSSSTEISASRCLARATPPTIWRIDDSQRARDDRTHMRTRDPSWYLQCLRAALQLNQENLVYARGQLRRADLLESESELWTRRENCWTDDLSELEEEIRRVEAAPQIVASCRWMMPLRHVDVRSATFAGGADRRSDLVLGRHSPRAPSSARPLPTSTRPRA
jgi:hypothetical protein